MRNKPLTSVIIPVYNVEKFLNRCLDSVLEQSYQNFEVICINDGSTDNSLQILEKYAKNDARIKIFTQSNQGVSVARNNGMQRMTGDYVCFIDADDYVEKDFLEMLVNSAQKNDADVVQSGYIQCNKRFVQKEKTCISFENIMNEMHRGFVWNKLWKADLLRKNQLYFLPHVIYEDVAFCSMGAFYAKKWNIIDYAGYHYTYNPNSLSNNQLIEKINKRLKDKITISREVIDFYKKQDCLDADLRIVENFLISQLLENSDLLNKDAYQNYKKLFRNNKLFIRKRRKALRKWLFQLSFKKKKFILLGHSFWKNDKV